MEQNLAEAAQMEIWEETGLCGQIVRFLAIFASRLWDSEPGSHRHHAVFLVDVSQGQPRPTPETKDAAFFDELNLPSLSPGHHRRVPFIFKLIRNEVAVPFLDPAPPIDDCA